MPEAHFPRTRLLGSSVNRGNYSSLALGSSIKDYCGVWAWKGSKNSRFDGWGNPSARAWGMSSSLTNRSNASCDSHTSTVRHPPSDVGPHTWISSPSGAPLRPNSWTNCPYCSHVTPGNSIKTPPAIGACSFLHENPHGADPLV